MPEGQRNSYAPLFARCIAHPCSIRSVLEDGRGELFLSKSGACGAIVHGSQFFGGDGFDWTADEIRTLIPVGSTTFVSVADAESLGSGAAFIDDDQYVYEGCAVSAQDLRSRTRRLPPGFRLQHLTSGLTGRAIAALGADVIGVFRDPRDFLENGVGVCVLEGRVVVAVATSLMRSRDRVEMSVYTRPDYRRQGLAGAAAAEMLSVCHARRWRPVWQATNDQSRSLAESLGFIDPRRVTVYMRIM